SATSASAAQMRPANPSVLHRFIDQLLDRLLDALPLRRRLLHQHEKHVLFAVDDEVAAAGAVPFQLAKRTRRRWFCVAGIGADAKAEPEAETIAGEIEIVAIDPRVRPDMIRRHQRERFRAEILLAAEFAARQH